MPLLSLLICLSLTARAQAPADITFDVTFNGKNIGTVQATEKVEGKHIIKDLRSNTDTKVLVMSIHVETEVNATYEKEVFIKGTAYRHANRGVDDIHAATTKVADNQYRIDKDGKQNNLKGREVNFCVIDLYFKEPKGLKEIYSNMYTAFVPIREVSPGVYEITNPEKSNGTYTYRNGKLTRIEVNTKVGKVVSVRR